MDNPVKEADFLIDKLDPLTLNEVNRNLSYMDILELSFTTPKMRENLMNTSLPVENLVIVFGATQSLVELTSPNRRLVISFGEVQGIQYGASRKFKFADRIFNFRRSVFGYHAKEQASVSDLIVVLKYVTTIFDLSKCKVAWLSLDLELISDSNVILENFRNFGGVGRLSLYSRLTNKKNFDSFNENFDNFMTTLKIRDIYVGTEFNEMEAQRYIKETEHKSALMRFEKLLNLDHICLRESAWMTAEDLCNLDVMTAILMNHRFTGPDVNKFVKHWMSSTSQKLWWLELSCDRGGFNKGEVTAGLELQPDSYTLTKNLECQCPHRRFAELSSIGYIFPETNYQITRLHDGVTATLSFSEYSFFFHVKNIGPIRAPPPPMIISNMVEEPLRGLRNCHAYVSRKNGSWYHALVGGDGGATITEVTSDEVMQAALKLEKEMDELERQFNRALRR